MERRKAKSIGVPATGALLFAGHAGRPQAETPLSNLSIFAGPSLWLRKLT
jgi:hypothetical protein